MAGDLSRPELEAAHCWEPADHVRGRPETTAFRRSARLLVTLEALLDADALPPPAGAALRARYLVPSS